MRHQFAVLVLRDECEILSADARNRHYRHHRSLMRSPDHSRADKLQIAQPVLVLAMRAFISTVCVVLSTSGETKLTRLSADRPCRFRPRSAPAYSS